MSNVTSALASVSLFVSVIQEEKGPGETASWSSLIHAIKYAGDSLLVPAVSKP